MRRAANAIGGIGDTVAAAPLLGAEYGVQAGKNIDATLKNWKQVEQEVKGDEHAQSLFDLLTDVDMDYNPTWPESRNRELISMGYNSKEIREMRQRLAGLEVSDGIDTCFNIPSGSTLARIHTDWHIVSLYWLTISCPVLADAFQLIIFIVSCVSYSLIPRNSKISGFR